LRPYSPGGVLNALASARQGSIPATPSTHRLGPGLPGYLIPFAPLAFAPQRQFRSRMPPSPPVFLQISTHFPLPNSSLVVSDAVPKLSLGISRLTDKAAYAPFTPSNSEQRLPPLYYRGCWHRVSRGFLNRYRHCPGVFTRSPFVPINRSLQSEDLHPPRGVASSGLRPLRTIPHCCLP
jgi:hypothetical protein